MQSWLSLCCNKCIGEDGSLKMVRYLCPFIKKCRYLCIDTYFILHSTDTTSPWKCTDLKRFNQVPGIKK